ncbi:B3 domain-containing protein Os07g0563300-like isoform X5 [Durio zibethinus]|uniref:B3 domain-containing protein Os07g0563300-like isoform X5 n=1 Tax=Durio zibethinus TaxID=66656 RepID=A0A6P5X533_DURZI|nr:B3 domain-containing protein Os07g0563300-like isoform X5 [Durio zibethinus]
MTSTSGAASSSKICFNSDCNDLKSERPRKGWRLRTGELAELCDRCACAFEEGRFCDTFHSKASGWRNCESCGKRVHCGCIVSFNAFTLLDAGGIECLACARKNVVLAPNSSWPPLLFHSSLSERFKDYSAKGWSQLAGSGPVPWRQAPSLFNSSIPQPELHSRVPYEVDLSTGIDRLNVSDRLSIPSLEKTKIEDFSERLMNGPLKLGAPDILENGNAGINCEEPPSSCLTKSQQPSLKEEPSNPPFGLAVPYTSPGDANGQIGVSGTHLRPNPQPPLAKQLHSNLHNGLDSSSETQIRNGRPRPDGRGRNQLFPRYWPRFTNQDLQQISGDSNSIITPLFEKMLSASDAGRIGRLVLPKKCAEAYFPAISQPEGLPLKVQDSKGKEWIFQFRFWPNNNSRMYVLEGVTPCIQNMQLQAGDVVTFSRLEPGGKLVMGFRKASTASATEQDAPILGKPTIFATDNSGEKIQWAQCEDCFKWRRLPSNALLPSKWICSSNSWDPERSFCLAPQELTTEQLEDLLPHCNPAASKKMKAAKREPENVDALEGLDTLANLAILGEGEALPASSQATTKHPRHRPGCSCIVCIQPPSGKGPKHKQTCTCNVCQTVKRRFRTLMLRREKKQSQKEAETTCKKPQPSLPDKVLDDDPVPRTNAGNSSPNVKKVVSEGSDNDPNRVKSSTSPFKGQIDLNIQPEREEELSPGADSGSMMRLIQDATERYLRQQMLSSGGNSNSDATQTPPGGGSEGEKISSSVNLGSSHRDSDRDHPTVFSIKTSAPSSATG